MPAHAEYVLPLRWTDDADAADLTAYLRALCHHIDITVVDASPPELAARHAQLWSPYARHLQVARPDGVNGKAWGVGIGVAAARHEHVVIADDDVRYGARTLRELLRMLEFADLVKPQNHFAPLPWHARWDTARSLLNRAVGSDYPGTYGLRASTFTKLDGYDPRVLFENLELERTVRAGGGRIRSCPHLYAARRPPSFRRFRGQRVRQAYDSLAQPARLALELALLPVVLLTRHRLRTTAIAAVAAVAWAEAGRRRHGGRAVFPATSAAWAPLWVTERAVTAWCAVAVRARGGVRYAGTRLSVAAHPRRWIRARLSPSCVTSARAPRERMEAWTPHPTTTSPPTT